MLIFIARVHGTDHDLVDGPGRAEVEAPTAKGWQLEEEGEEQGQDNSQTRDMRGTRP